LINPISFLAFVIGLFGATYACIQGIRKIWQTFYDGTNTKINGAYSYIKNSREAQWGEKCKAWTICYILGWGGRFVWWLASAIPTILFSCYIYYITYSLFRSTNVSGVPSLDEIALTINCAQHFKCFNIGFWIFVVCILISAFLPVFMWLFKLIIESIQLAVSQRKLQTPNDNQKSQS